MRLKGDRKVALFTSVHDCIIPSIGIDLKKSARRCRDGKAGKSLKREFPALGPENWKNTGVSCYLAVSGRYAGIRKAGFGDGNDCPHRPFPSGPVDSMRFGMEILERGALQGVRNDQSGI